MQLRNRIGAMSRVKLGLSGTAGVAAAVTVMHASVAARTTSGSAAAALGCSAAAPMRNADTSAIVASPGAPERNFGPPPVSLLC